MDEYIERRRMFDHEARILSLEKLAITMEARLQKTEEFNQKMVDRLDEHLIRDNDNQIELVAKLTHLTTSFDNLADALKDAAHGASLAVKHETMIITATKMLTAGAAVVAALWALFKYFA